MHCPPHHWHPEISGNNHSARLDAIARIAAITNGFPRPSCEPCAMWSSQDLRNRPEQKKCYWLIEDFYSCWDTTEFTVHLKQISLACTQPMISWLWLSRTFAANQKQNIELVLGLRAEEEKNLFMLCCHTCPGDRKHKHLAGWNASIVHTVTRSKNSRCLFWLSSMLFSESLNMFSHTLWWNPSISE